MPPKLRRLSGKQIVSILNRFGFQMVSQRGTHAKLRRIGRSGAREAITIPVHDELDVGTLHAILDKRADTFPRTSFALTSIRTDR